MNNLEKLRIIERDVVPKIGAKIEQLSSSIKITHACGCILVRHFAAGEPMTVNKEKEPEKYELIALNRKYYIELCDNHKVLKYE